MASEGKVTAEIAVRHKIAIGPTTVAGGGITLVAYGLAVVAFIQGARDEQTVSALVIGTLSLLTTLGGRYAQAVAALLALKAKEPAAQAPAYTSSPISTGTIAGSVSTQAWTSPRPGASVSRPVTIATEAPDPAGEVPGGGVPVPEDTP